MKLKQLSVLLLAILGTSTVVQAQTAKPNLSKAFIQQQLDAAAKQIKVLVNETPTEKFPKLSKMAKRYFLRRAGGVRVLSRDIVVFI
jgi:hypothetical protein